MQGVYVYSFDYEYKSYHGQVHVEDFQAFYKISTADIFDTIKKCYCFMC